MAPGRWTEGPAHNASTATSRAPTHRPLTDRRSRRRRRHVSTCQAGSIERQLGTRARAAPCAIRARILSSPADCPRAVFSAPHLPASNTGTAPQHLPPVGFPPSTCPLPTPVAVACLCTFSPSLRTCIHTFCCFCCFSLRPPQLPAATPCCRLPYMLAPRQCTLPLRIRLLLLIVLLDSPQATVHGLQKKAER